MIVEKSSPQGKVGETESYKIVKRKKAFSSNQWQLHLLIVPAVVLTLIFIYVPMLGLVMAFQDYKPYLGIMQSPWVGLDQFKLLFSLEESRQVIWNTLIIQVSKIFLVVLMALVFSLLLNEVRRMSVKKWIQTVVFFPHFLSWVVLGGIYTDVLALDGGYINRLIQTWFGMEPLFFLGNGDLFRFTAIFTDVWKEFGYFSIIYLAALTGINPALYEAAEIDGANRWQQTLYITLPSLIPVTIVLLTLLMGYILSAGFDQILNLYNPMVYDKGDIIDTYVYRIGLLGGNFSFATAVGFFKSVVSVILVVSCYKLAHKYANYRIF